MDHPSPHGIQSAALALVGMVDLTVTDADLRTRLTSSKR